MTILTPAEIQSLVAADLSKVEAELRDQLRSDVGPITEVGEHLLNSGGKRVRPTLMLLAAGLVGGTNPAIIRLAAIIEFIHTATLVHDDIIDASNTRRGRPSTNSVWGNSVAVFAGDWLYMQSFAMAIKENNGEILQTLIDITRSMVEGELLQLTLIGKLEITQSQILDIVERKTAALFSGCTKLPAIANGTHPSAVARLAEVGRCLGISFQLIDDLLDVTSTAEILGKPVASDLAEGKLTVPVLAALRQADAAGIKKVKTVFEEGGFHSVRRQEILELVDHSGGLTYTRRLAIEYAQRAVKALDGFASSSYKDAFLSIADFVVNREF
jgi:octaprenyl-diphosphate synthase